MRSLVRAWRRLQRRVRAARRLVLFLDFDGTLAPLVDHPSQARVPDHIRAVLKQLNSIPRVSVSIISGRRLQDLKRCVRVRGLSYIGNHGLEAEGPCGRYCHSMAQRSRPLMKRLARDLQAAIDRIPGAWVEDKGLTLSVHYRRVRLTGRPRLRWAIRQMMRPHEDQRRLRMRSGKAVWEIRPAVQWHKGTAIEWLLRRIHARHEDLIICLGDDRTDEDAFQAVNRLRGISILVGRRRETTARYWLRDVSAVSDWLGRLASELRGSEISTR